MQPRPSSATRSMAATVDIVLVLRGAPAGPKDSFSIRLYGQLYCLDNRNAMRAGDIKRMCADVL